jgi:hypothetical protein
MRYFRLEADPPSAVSKFCDKKQNGGCGKNPINIGTIPPDTPHRTVFGTGKRSAVAFALLIRALMFRRLNQAGLKTYL